MEKNIPSNENQRSAIKAILPSKALNQNRTPNKELPRQKKSKRICLHKTSFSRDAKWTALRKGRKRERERERETQVQNMAMNRCLTTVLGDLDTYMQRNETRSPTYTIHKNKLKVDKRLKYKL